MATPLGNSNGLVNFTVGTNAAPIWQSAVGSTGNSSIRWATPAAAGTVLVAGEFSSTITRGGTTLTSAGGFDVSVAKFNPSTASYAWAVRANPAILSVAPGLPHEPLALYLHPAHGRTILRLPAAGVGALQLFDAMGREVRRYAAPAGPSEVPLALRGLPAGVYIVRAGNSSRQLLVE